MSHLCLKPPSTRGIILLFGTLMCQFLYVTRPYSCITWFKWSSWCSCGHHSQDQSISWSIECKQDSIYCNLFKTSKMNSICGGKSQQLILKDLILKNYVRKVLQSVSAKFLLLFTINKFTKIIHLIRFRTDCKASYNVKTGRQSVSILLQEELVKLIASHWLKNLAFCMA